MEIIDRISSKLEMLGEQNESLKPFIQERLKEIEMLISIKTNEKKEFLKKLRETPFTISSISKELGCSRTSLYQYDKTNVLKRYIELSVNIFQEDNPYVLNEKLATEKKELQQQINLMMDRDITVEILKKEKDILASDLIEREKQITRMQARVDELNKEVSQLRSLQPKTSGTVISITQMKND